MTAMLRSSALLVALVASLAASGRQSPPTTPDVATVAGRTTEPWADPGLEVTRGLVLWLDGGRVDLARQAYGLPEVRDGDAVDTWHDASGHARHLAAPDDAARPVVRDGALRFDGLDDALERDAAGLRLRESTLFVVAAPFSNPGGFRGLLAMGREDQDDFISGLNLDLGPWGSPRLGALNVEGAGMSGIAFLNAGESDFGVVRRFTLTSAPGASGTRLDADGGPGGARDRAESTLIGDRIAVGARRYGGGGTPTLRGFLDGDLFHVLLYDRVLDDAERGRVERFLAERYGERRAVEPPRRPIVGIPLVAEDDPPPVQVLVPGFSARELPVDLRNVNNVRYRPDGTLVALTYDGDVFLLTDRDGDGLEEHAAPFWEGRGRLIAPIGMALTPTGYHLGDGLFVAGKGKVSLIVDRDRDGRADEEIVVAEGWEALPHGVDALGVAVDREGAVYFGLGAANFTNPYLLDDRGQPHYDVSGERGTILRVAPDFGRREAIATGIRFPVGLAFNRLGDLFATDQEGATWLPNGNPFDELLHIQEGRHYGFPPRHPRHLPAVIDEPSTFDYAPQHQSTCGLAFNEPVGEGPAFGPPEWQGDALVAGYSRGKLYRTTLAKTSAGYVAQNHLLACLNMLPVDVAVSPSGDLVVAAHSGLPDWGSGPTGRGKLYKISGDGQQTPLPAIAWASGPNEVRVAFDRPLDPAGLRDLADAVSIERGEAVRPGDRFESLRPGYEVVHRQLTLPRFALPVRSAQVTADRRTLVLATDAHPEATSYALTIRGLRPEGEAPGALPQRATIDLGYDLSGVSAEWRPDSGSAPWSGWWPHPDPGVALAFTEGSADHDRLRPSIDAPGRLTLRTQVDLSRMLRPADQPGSDPGYELPPEVVTLRFDGSGPIVVESPAGTVASHPEGGRHVALLTVGPEAEAPLPVAVAMESPGPTTLEVSFSTSEDPRPRPLPLRRFLLPWATLAAPSESAGPRAVPELAGGDWERGRAVFFGEVARCSSCHRVRGRGGAIGPDLSNLVHRDYGSVLRDIREPAATINPDYIAHAVALADGRVLQGTIRTEGDLLVVGDTEGTQTAIDRSAVEEVAPSSSSVMPEGLADALDPDALRDLLTFLLTDPLGPAPIEVDGAPPPRRRAEVEAVLEGGTSVEHPRPIRVVLAAGPKDHGPGEHDYPLWQSRWSALLSRAEGVAVDLAQGWPTDDQLDGADLVVLYSNNPGWSEASAESLDRYLARGGGLVLVHYAVDGHDHVDALADRIGLAWKGGASRFRHGALEVDLSGSDHPIARGFGTLRLVDESYWNLVGDPSRVDVLGTAVEDGAPRPLFWTRTQGDGRVFVSIPGHYSWTFDDPLFRVLLLRGMAWSAGEPVDRFDELATLGARVGD